MKMHSMIHNAAFILKFGYLMSLTDNVPKICYCLMPVAHGRNTNNKQGGIGNSVLKQANFEKGSAKLVYCHQEGFERRLGEYSSARA